MSLVEKKVEITNIVPDIGITYVRINDVDMTPQDAVQLGTIILKAGERGKTLNQLLALLADTLEGDPRPILRSFLKRLG